MLYDHRQSAPQATLPIGTIAVTSVVLSRYFRLLLAASPASLLQLFCFLLIALSC